MERMWKASARMLSHKFRAWMIKLYLFSVWLIILTFYYAKQSVWSYIATGSLAWLTDHICQSLHLWKGGLAWKRCFKLFSTPWTQRLRHPKSAFFPKSWCGEKFMVGKEGTEDDWRWSLASQGRNPPRNPVISLQHPEVQGRDWAAKQEGLGFLAP